MPLPPLPCFTSLANCGKGRAGDVYRACFTFGRVVLDACVGLFNSTFSTPLSVFDNSRPRWGA